MAESVVLWTLAASTIPGMSGLVYKITGRDGKTASTEVHTPRNACLTDEQLGSVISNLLVRI